MKSKNLDAQIERPDANAGGASKTPMKILLSFRGLNARAAWHRLVESQMQRLQNLAAIASARVTVEKQREIKPPFKVKALLEVPGPDFHAEASDHTLPGGFAQSHPQPGTPDPIATQPPRAEAKSPRAAGLVSAVARHSVRRIPGMTT